MGEGADSKRSVACAGDGALADGYDIEGCRMPHQRRLSGRVQRNNGQNRTFYLGNSLMAAKKAKKSKKTKKATKATKATKVPKTGKKKKELYTLAETARILGMTEDQVGKAVADRKLEPVTQDEQLMFGCDQVDDAAANLADFVDDGGQSADAQQTMTEQENADLDDDDTNLDDSLVIETAPSTGSGLLDLDLSGLESLVEDGRGGPASGADSQNKILADDLAAGSGAPVAESIESEAEVALRNIELDSRESSQEIDVDLKAGAQGKHVGQQSPSGAGSMPETIPQYELVALVSLTSWILGGLLLIAGFLVFLVRLGDGFTEAWVGLGYAAAGCGLCIGASLLTLARDAAINLWHIRANSRDGSG